MNKWIKRITFMALVLFVCAGLKVSAQAAEKPILLKEGKVYSKYDVTGDGKKDKVSVVYYDRSYGEITVNKKVYDWEFGKGRNGVYLCVLKNSRAVIVASGNSTGGSWCDILTFPKGKLKCVTVDEAATLLNSSGNDIYFTIESNKFDRIFKNGGYSGKMKYTVSGTSVKRASKYVKISGTYKARCKITTASTSACKDKKGVSIKKGQTVKLVKLDRDTRAVCVEVSGKRGWIKNTGSTKVNYQCLEKKK